LCGSAWAEARGLTARFHAKRLTDPVPIQSANSEASSRLTGMSGAEAPSSRVRRGRRVSAGPIR